MLANIKLSMTRNLHELEEGKAYLVTLEFIYKYRYKFITLINKLQGINTGYAKNNFL